MAESGDDGLETWLNKATNPLIREEDWEAIVGFCDLVNKELEGPQTAVRLLIHKIQSPQEKESLFALTTLEACVKNCGRRFQQEIGKFRFINEIIKVVSPKYLGNHMSEKVKQRCIELLYSWSQVLTQEPKIKEAYQMLRRQGIIKQDPDFVDHTLEIAPPPPPRNSIFEDEDKSKLLSRLLRSKNQEDLQAANRLIKNMVKQDAERIEKVTKRIQQLETVYNNVKLLTEMLNNHQPNSSTESDREIMKELNDNLEKQRPNLFRLASDTDEHDSTAITEILKANDEVMQVMSLYEQIINKIDTDGTLLASGETKEGKPSFLKDLEFLSISEPSTSYAHSNASSLLDEQLLSLGFETSSTTNGISSDASHPSKLDDLDDIFGPVQSASTNSTLSSLDLLNTTRSFTQSNFNFSSTAFSTPPAQHASSTTMSLPLGHTNTFNSGIGFINPVHAASNAGKANLIGQTLSNSSKSGQGSVSGAPSSVISDLFRPATDNRISFGSENILQATTKSSTSSESVLLTSSSSGLESLNELSRTYLQQSLSNSGLKPFQSTSAPVKIPMNQITKVPLVPIASATPSPGGASKVAASIVPAAAPSPPLPPYHLETTPKASAAASGGTEKEMTEAGPVSDLFVPLETIQPGLQSPILAYQKNDIKIVFHFGRDRPRPDVQVMVVSTSSTLTSPVKNFNFQAAVPKVMKIHLQTSSTTDLPAFNPILPSSAITQVMLISHPLHENIRLKFKISYTVNDAVTTDVGEVEDIPVD